MQAAALEPDRQWLKAETLMLEAAALRKQGNQATPQAIEKLQQALPLWRELNEPLWTALTLDAIGSAFYTLRQHEKAIEFHQQALALSRESLLRARKAWRSITWAMPLTDSDVLSRRLNITHRRCRSDAS